MWCSLVGNLGRNTGKKIIESIVQPNNADSLQTHYICFDSQGLRVGSWWVWGFSLGWWKIFWRSLVIAVAQLWIYWNSFLYFRRDNFYDKWNLKLLKLHVWCICIACELSKLSFETVEERNVVNSSDICCKGFKIKWNTKPQGFVFLLKTQEREHSILNQEHSLHVIISYWHIMHF